MKLVRTLANLAMLPVEMWLAIWTLPDDYYAGQEHDLISTICYLAVKIIWVLVTLLTIWLLICPLFGF